VADNGTVVSGVAGRYASALFDLAQEAGSVDQVRNDLSRFDSLVEGSPDLQRLVKSPVFSADEQKAALTAILAKVGIGGVASYFVRLVADKRRLFAIRDMIRAYNALADAKAGLSRAEITLAETPSDKLKGEIEKAVADLAGGKVAVDTKIDPSIIGGIVVKLGSRMFDASLRTKLNGIRIAMKEVG
jgi:F-type H+-transporting ATPase subunit delta